MDETSLNIIKRITRRSRPVPFKIVTVEADDGAVWLCVYENEVMSYDDDGRAAILAHMQGLRAEIQKYGHTVHLIGRPGDPPNPNERNTN